MQKQTDWQGLPYFPISQFYRQLFGSKVWKIPVSVAETCPNREGLKGMKPCIFCDEWGSAAYPEFRDRELREQIKAAKQKISKRYNVDQFLIYFQAYTNTFTRVKNLKEMFDVALEFDDVRGFVLGTRPDCISTAVLELWQEYLQKTFISIELGVQSFDENQLIWMSRGHTAKKSVQAIQKIKLACPNIDLGIHLIFGLPNESDHDLKQAALICNSLPIDNIKLHNLHVLKNTPLEKQFNEGSFVPIDRSEYARRVELFVQHLNPKIAVHRLAAVASRHDELVAPMWAKSKLDTYQFMIDYMKNNSTHQGQLF